MNQTKPAHPYPGVLAIFEGVDGAGKSTGAKAMAQHFRDAGYEVLETREPGGSPMAEKIRSLVLGKEEPITAKAELLLFAAARELHIHNVIIPALREGKVVICDRFMMSTRAYQGYGRKLKKEVMQLEEFVLDGFYPDFLFYYNVSFESAQKRLAERVGKSDRLDEEAEKFKRDVYHGFRVERIRLELDHPEMTIVEVDASQSVAYLNRTYQSWIRNSFTRWEQQRPERLALLQARKILKES